jgi:hypothetical protein
MAIVPHTLQVLLIFCQESGQSVVWCGGSVVRLALHAGIVRVIQRAQEGRRASIGP